MGQLEISLRLPQLSSESRRICCTVSNTTQVLITDICWPGGKREGGSRVEVCQSFPILNNYVSWCQHGITLPADARIEPSTRHAAMSHLCQPPSSAASEKGGVAPATLLSPAPPISRQQRRPQHTQNVKQDA
ncbi:hypothetical protein AAFF_G00183220 [Aldrovandia affinis]|uniref:Uncharacterized protein n=1 Tax=Aldrovandia affinis TaxID=143900 RepID=A0AAD7W6M3_9TELE|nr:hypothetical protein AAFF_G00183220 [Aldrovandia affinis]